MCIDEEFECLSFKNYLLNGFHKRSSSSTSIKSCLIIGRNLDLKVS